VLRVYQITHHSITQTEVLYKLLKLTIHKLLKLTTHLQVVNMQFEGGATAILQMVAFSSRVCAREVKIYGTKVHL